MTYHSDYDAIGFRKGLILPVLAKHGITLNPDQEVPGATYAVPVEPEMAPAWKLRLSMRKRLSVYEAACVLSNVDPFSESDSVERYGSNEAVYDMNKALLDEAIEIGMVKSFGKADDHESRHLVDAESLAVWCDNINLPRPLPWSFEKGQAVTDSEQEQQNDNLRRRLVEAQKEADRLKAEVSRLESELAQAKASQPIQQQAQDGGLKFRHETRLLHLVAATQERYAGENLDISDRDTWPKKADVIEWLREQEPGLSGKVAEGIDAIAMPFNRGK